MRDLSFTQEFFLCALKPSGSTVLVNPTESTVCLLAGALLELVTSSSVELDDKSRVFVKQTKKPKEEYLAFLYEFIQSQKPMKVEKVAEKFIFDLKKPKELFQLVGRSLVEDGYATEKTGKGLLKNKISFIPNEYEMTKVIEKLRAEFLEQGKISDEVIILGALLCKSHLIKNYFSKYEVQKLKERLQEISQSKPGILVQKLVDDIDTWIVIISASGSGA